MEATWLYTPLFVLLLVAFKLFSQTRRRLNLPPSPPGLPIIGHLHLLKQPLHRTLHSISRKHGPIFSLWFGNRFTVVVSSPSAVEECFTKNDVVLANRPPFILAEYVSYNHSNIVATPYGDHWRNLRRLSALEIFSSHRLKIFLPIRVDEVKHLLRSLYQNTSRDFAKVELKSKFSELSFNIILRMVAGKRYFGDDVGDYEEAKQFRELMREIFQYAAVSNPSDFLPFLRWIDYQKMEKNLGRLGKKMDLFLQGMIDEHRRDKSINSMINHLLSLQESQPEYYTDQIIKGLVMALIFGGTDTTAVTIEWAMSFLLNHPEVLKKARIELDANVGQDCLIGERDLSKLHYLHCIILETFRLCPAGPLLVPHMSSNDCTIGGYDVPRNTILLVNAWAIHRDPEMWDNPTNFRPERFEGRVIETHKLIPFGMGRRSCPGAGLAQRVIGLALGSLIQCFEWERTGETKVDLTEGNGLSMPKVEPLEAMCKARDTMKKVIINDENNALSNLVS